MEKRVELLNRYPDFSYELGKTTVSETLCEKFKASTSSVLRITNFLLFFFFTHFQEEMGIVGK